MKTLKLPALKKSRTGTLSTPPTVHEHTAAPPVGVASSALSVTTTSTTSLHDAPNSNSSHLTTIPSSGSSPSLSLPISRLQSPDTLHPVRPKSECYSSPTRKSTNGSVSPATPSSPSPLAPRLLSVLENQWVHQSLLLVFGQVGIAEKPCGGMVTVYHHLETYPATQWPVSEGYFKALVHLEPGPNKVRFCYSSGKGSSFSSTMTLNMLPLTTSPPLHLAVVVGRDSGGELDCQGEKVEGLGGIDAAVAKLRMAGHLIQAFTSDQMYRNRLGGRRCFRLEEEWAQDTLSNRISGLRSVAKVHIIRSGRSAKTIHKLEAAGDASGLKELAQDAVDVYFHDIDQSPMPKRYIAAVMLDVKGNLKLNGRQDHSALNGGLGLIGSRSLHTLPSCIEEVVPAFSDCTRIGTSGEAASDVGYYWEAATVALGSMIEAFLSPQLQSQPRSFERINRTFITKESYSMRNKSPGLKVSLPEDECSWPRVDCLRFRYHPCFRLPTDPILPTLQDVPQIYAVENGIVAGANSGIALVLLYLNDKYQEFMEFANKPKKEVLLQEDELRAKLPEGHRNGPLKLKIFSAGQGETFIDFATAKSSKLKLPNGCGTAYRSTSPGLCTGKPQGAHSQDVILRTPQRMLTGIRIFHDKTALDGLEFKYEDQSSQVFGNKGSDKHASEFPFDARKGELLMGFGLRSGHFGIDGIEILTTFGRKSPVFGPASGSITTLIPPRGRSIAGVSGNYEKYVHDFSIIYR